MFVRDRDSRIGPVCLPPIKGDHLSFGGDRWTGGFEPREGTLDHLRWAS